MSAQLWRSFAVFQIFLAFSFLSTHAFADKKDGGKKEIDRIWDTVVDAFPKKYRVSKNHVAVVGADVGSLLSKMIPDAGDHSQTIIDNLDGLSVIREKGLLKVEAILVPESLPLHIKDEDDCKNGQIYEVILSQRVYLEVAAHGDDVEVRNIKGVKMLAKLPWMPDAVYPTSAYLDNGERKLTINLEAIWRTVDVVATIDMKEKKMDGVDWMQTLNQNAELIGLIAIIL